MDLGRRTIPWKWCAPTHRLCDGLGPCAWADDALGGFARTQGRVATEKGSRKAWSEGVCRLMSAWSPPSSCSVSIARPSFSWTHGPPIGGTSRADLDLVDPTTSACLVIHHAPDERAPLARCEGQRPICVSRNTPYLAAL